MPHPQYSVVLRSDLPSRERQLFEQFCCEITSEGGESLLHFVCQRIDTTHPFYLSMDTFKPGADDEDVHPIQIPHNFVVLISGTNPDGSIGFLTDLRPASDEK